MCSLFCFTEPYSQYEVRVIASNGAGDGPPAIVNATTREEGMYYVKELSFFPIFLVLWKVWFFLIWFFPHVAGLGFHSNFFQGCQLFFLRKEFTNNYEETVFPPLLPVL